MADALYPSLVSLKLQNDCNETKQVELEKESVYWKNYKLPIN